MVARASVGRQFIEAFFISRRSSKARSPASSSSPFAPTPIMIYMIYLRYHTPWTYVWMIFGEIMWFRFSPLLLCTYVNGASTKKKQPLFPPPLSGREECVFHTQEKSKYKGTRRVWEKKSSMTWKFDDPTWTDEKYKYKCIFVEKYRQRRQEDYSYGNFSRFLQLMKKKCNFLLP